MARRRATDTPLPPVASEGEISHDQTSSPLYLGVGLYSLPEVARLLQMPSATLRRWLLGSASMVGNLNTPPLVRRDDAELVARGLLTFTELIELLLIRRLREAGVSLTTIRAVAEQVAAALQTPHPFAVAPFYAERTSPLTGNGDTAFLPRDVSAWGNNEAVWETVRAEFAAQLDFAEDRVRRYWPLGKERRVVLDPGRAFGQATDPASGVLTRVLADSHAAGETVDAVAEWYRVEPEAVRDAILFEQAIVAPRPTQAGTRDAGG
jgi:uncharacterized protein (DUF433 family)